MLEHQGRVQLRSLAALGGDAPAVTTSPRARSAGRLLINRILFAGLLTAGLVALLPDEVAAQQRSKEPDRACLQKCSRERERTVNDCRRHGCVPQPNIAAMYSACQANCNRRGNYDQAAVREAIRVCDRGECSAARTNMARDVDAYKRCVSVCVSQRTKK